MSGDREMLRTLTCFIMLLVGAFPAVAQESESNSEPEKAAKSSQADAGDVEIVRVDQKIFTTRSKPMSLALAPETEAFQIAIYGDRTGGDPSGLKFLRQAVDDTNLIDPDFVMTVGDLIQGYNRPDEWIVEMKEFRDIMDGLDMEWFPVAGNHDIYWDFRDPNRPQKHHEANYEKNFGPLWYSFQHKNNGFIVLFSDEGDLENGDKGFREGRMQNMSDQQLEFLEKALAKLSDCDHVFCFLHHPRWLGGGYEGSNWPEVHKRMVAAKNVAAVFAGHIHHMTYHGPVDGIEYYSLATTGGHLSMESVELGYLHHFNLVTIRPDGFSVSAIPVGGVLDPKDFDKAMLDDVNVVRGARPKRNGEKLLVKPDASVSQAYAMTVTNPGAYPLEATFSPTVPAGWQAIPDHQHVVIGPGKTEEARFFLVHADDMQARGGWSNQAVPSVRYQYEYLHPKGRIKLPEQTVAIDMGLAEIPADAFATDASRSLHLRGRTSAQTRRRRATNSTDSAVIQSSEIDLPQGPFTLEAWVCATKIDGSRGVVCKTQSSEYAIFLHNGIPSFDVHLSGTYVSPKASKKVELDKWTHLAGVFDGKECHMFVDGKKVQSLKGSGTRRLNQLPLFVGADPDGNGNPTREFAGEIDEVRLSTGVRYTEDFVPSRRHETDSETKMLLHFDQQVGPFVIDDSANRTGVMLLGDANVAPVTEGSDK
ncbi:LamG-like jellyroll fold domain-containing protein [Mariniblastus fucicola]|uniref:Laminin G domain protein n=1 Tax=Mariniblastus fucicola TaxID=980251 RepID=A0A5B9PC66_9BACT|nr:LamG-like jellyroll fold domain-containing protein [Mariniblastus fucicola]QEG20701.1 Laminin G domain protein [Mariniblastus fucicola]